MQTPDAIFYDEAALIERLTTGVRRANQQVVFLVGSPLTAPVTPDGSGVPGVGGVVELIRSEFDSPDQLTEFDKALEAPGTAYQNAFSFLLGRRGQQIANEVIKRAVWKARKHVTARDTPHPYSPSAATSDEACRALDGDVEGWLLPPAADALGRLLASYPDRFGRAALTTNFDPLLEVAIVRAGGHFFRTVLHRDGNIGQTEGMGCHVIHLHGYWYGADTLHTPRQLNQSRPRLKASLSTLIKSKTLVVSGYGGWDDTFTEALMEIVLDDNAFPEIIWTFRSAPSSTLIERLTPGIDRGRVTLYSDIDCHAFFPRLLSAWSAIEPAAIATGASPPSSRLSAIVSSREVIEPASSATSRIIEGGEEDRPPLIMMCLGREPELECISQGQERAIFLTGIGGQGKSTIAAQYFATAQTEKAFDLYVWRDCKEQSERLENQIVAIIELLSAGRATSKELSAQPMHVLAELLAKASGDKSILFVFDNVDHYIDLEHNKLSGNADAFLLAFLSHTSKSRMIFTCRPIIDYKRDDILTLGIEGLGVDAAIELFKRRGAAADLADIREAHLLTGGHAIWLDLIAAQIAKSATNLSLRDILPQLGRGSTSIPAATLTSIWDTLRDRQKLVLRSMAETVRPETDEQIAEYLQGRVNFNQVNRALRSLRDLNSHCC